MHGPLLLLPAGRFWIPIVVLLFHVSISGFRLVAPSPRRLFQAGSERLERPKPLRWPSRRTYGWDGDGAVDRIGCRALPEDVCFGERVAVWNAQRWVIEGRHLPSHPLVSQRLQEGN